MLCIVGEQQNDILRVGKEFVREHGLHLCAVRKARIQNGVHGPLRDLGNGLLLLGVRLLHESGKLPRLVDDHHGIGRHHQEDRDEHEIEDLLLDAADHNVLVFFHKLLSPR